MQVKSVSSVTDRNKNAGRAQSQNISSRKGLFSRYNCTMKSNTTAQWWILSLSFTSFSIFVDLVPFMSKVHVCTACLNPESPQYLEDGLGTFLVVCLGFLHNGDEGQLLQVLQDGESGTFLGQLLAVALALGGELSHSDTGQEAFHVWRAALFQHLDRAGTGLEGRDGNEKLTGASKSGVWNVLLETNVKTKAGKCCACTVDVCAQSHEWALCVWGSVWGALSEQQHQADHNICSQWSQRYPPICVCIIQTHTDVETHIWRETCF